MKLQAHVIMNLALGISVGFGAAACQKTGEVSADRAESKTVTDIPVQSDWSYLFLNESAASVQKVPDGYGGPVPTSVKPRDPCPRCGMG